jgi:hypothetical protein
MQVLFLLIGGGLQMNQFYAFVVPGGLAIFVAVVGFVALFLQQRRHARAVEQRDGHRKAALV